ncbi:MAG: prenyltransferase/squalene oxidase repeat-containing protein [Anaerolineae bacterium]
MSRGDARRFIAPVVLLLAVVLALRVATLAAYARPGNNMVVETRHGVSLPAPAAPWRGATAPSPMLAAASTDEERSAARALDWLAAAQAADGGYGDVAATLAVLRAIGDGGRSAADWRGASGPSILTYLAPRVAAYADRDTVSASQAILALAAAGEDPHAFGGTNLVQRLQAHFDPTSGLYEGRFGTTLDQVTALLALAAAHEPLPPTVTTRVAAAQADDGGWPPTPGAPSDVETTALAAATLVAAGQDPSALTLRLAASFLSRAQDSDGGFRRSSTCGCAPDAISTARAVPAVLLLGFDPLGDGWYRPNGAPTSWLARAQRADGGVALAPNLASNVRATAYAVTAWLGRPLVPLGRGAAVSAGLAWLRQRQRADGGFSAAGETSDPDLTVDALLALAAAGEDVRAWRARTGLTGLDFLAARPLPDSAAATARLILAVQAHGADPRAFGGADLTQRLASFLDASRGVYGQTTPDQAWALLALAALRQPPPPGAVERLIDWQASDGGWPPRASVASDTVTTALVLQALVASDAVYTVRSRARAYLMMQQNPFGGFGSMDGETATATRATAAALQALVALDENPRAAPWVRHATPPDNSPLPAHNPAQALLALQDVSGAFHPQAGFPEPDASATAQALLALAGRAQPLRGQTLRLYLPLLLYRH